MTTNLIIQTQSPAIDDIGLIGTHLKAMESLVSWTNVGILFDEDHQNEVILLLDGSKPVSILRFCLDVKTSVIAINDLLPEKGVVYVGFYQGNTFTKDQIISLDVIAEIWETVSAQTGVIEGKLIERYFFQQDTETKEKGRGKDFTVETKRLVHLAAHSRCMFEGCGEKLNVDDLTGHAGNYSYLAHNVSSSEQSARGGVVISELLSNDPCNVLLLCDKHHRLIDKVAAMDYPAQKLTGMRRKFVETADSLLNGLMYQPIEAYSVLWPVGGHVVSPPTQLQISHILATTKMRAEGPLRNLSDNNDFFMQLAPEELWKILPSHIENVAEKLLQQAHFQQHRASLFAFGLMPALIALGAKLGNKSHIYPMLRYRDSGSWLWPRSEAKKDVTSVCIDPDLNVLDEEVVITLSLTARPPEFDKLIESTGFKEVAISTSDENSGNGCIGHPEEGEALISQVHDLLHQLVSDYGIKKVHVLPCASNAACIFFGKAIDNFHPEVVVYDFFNGEMLPRVLINSHISGVKLTSV
ncbi:MAG: SAVED domain-containing protein [Pseudomonadales bacterium]|nr:SAVED domain-containing protein [Pseudomonadales bacterium]